MNKIPYELHKNLLDAKANLNKAIKEKRKAERAIKLYQKKEYDKVQGKLFNE